MIRPFCCTVILSKPILVVALLMSVWSIILLGLAASDLAKANKGGSTQGGDANNRTYREEVGFEFGGALLGVLSCVYHVLMVQCCDNQSKGE